MEIKLSNTGKKYQHEWVCRGVELELRVGDTLAILGKNGSGKTTLMKLMAGAALPSEGEITVTHEGLLLPPEKLYQFQAYAAPYHELIEEFTVREMAEFYTRFKSLNNNISITELLSSVNLLVAADKKVRACSSGMKQRLKLALALYSDTPLLLLDEPLTNLDPEGISWFQEEMHRRSRDRIVVVCSNHIKEEYDFCKRCFKMEENKSGSL